MTQFAQRDGDGWTFGEKIIPLSEREAREWARQHIRGDDFLGEWPDHGVL